MRIRFDKKNDHQSLAQARAMVMARRDRGVICPCCDRYARVYVRKFNSQMARFLVWLLSSSRAAGGNDTGIWISATSRGKIGANVVASQKASTDGSYLTHYGFIVAHPVKRGLWRITPSGESFARGHGTAPSHFVMYGNQCLRLLGASDGHADINIHQALGNHFKLSELLDEKPQEVTT